MSKIPTVRRMIKTIRDNGGTMKWKEVVSELAITDAQSICLHADAVMHTIDHKASTLSRFTVCITNEEVWVVA